MKPERIGAKSEKRVGTDFTQGAIMPMLITFAIPFLLGNLLTALYNTVDSIIVGHLIGSAGFVAVTVGGKTLNLFTHISVSFVETDLYAQFSLCKVHSLAKPSHSLAYSHL